ncbi:MAG: DHH family phosphoesterase [archaeon]
MQLKKLFEKRRVLIITHLASDVDAIATAAALYFTFNNKARKIVLSAVDHVSLPAVSLAKNLDLKLMINVNPKDFDNVILVDFSSKEMAGSQIEKILKVKNLYTLDHHKKDSSFIGKGTYLIDWKVVSTTQLLYHEFKKQAIKVSPKTALCLSAGIITDSAGFKLADAKTFQDLSELMFLAGKDYSEIIKLFSLERNVSEKIALLKALRRSKVYRLTDYLIVTSNIDCFESSAANQFVRLGASVALVVGKQKNRTTLSARASQEFVKKFGFGLVKNLFVQLESKFNGYGGGHEGAGSFSAENIKEEKLMDESAKIILEFLKEKKVKGKMKVY